MFPFQRSTTSAILLACLLLPLTGCAGSSLGGVFQRSLQADDPSKLNGSAVGNPATVDTASQTQLPSDFPGAIPRYPGAVLQEVVPATSASVGATTDTSDVITRWRSSDPGDRILAFYRDQLQTNSWQLLNDPTNSQPGTLTAKQENLNLTIAVEPGNAVPGQTTAPQTLFAIRYNQTGGSSNPNIAQSPSPSPSPKGGDLAQLPAFSTSTSAGVSGSTDSSQNQIASGPTSFSDLNKAPKQLQPYLQDLASLGVLTPANSGSKTNQAKDSSRFEPNKAITRREFARWLVSTNNRLNIDRPAQQIRPALESSQPAFRDVPRSDPDFAVIQGLAEAGLIPSSLSGVSTAVTFRPNAPLTRETLLLWKVPLDTRQGLPTATIDAVKQTWGFQDAAKIEPRALRAVLSDYQNGDQSNIRRVFGYTTLFQPKKAVTRAEAAAALWYFGFQDEGVTAQDALKSGNTQREG